ncbi:MAG TPA: YciI family protein [Dongiaceae bacterium]
MLYCIFCYNDDEMVGNWSKSEEEAVMTRLAVVQDKLAATGKLGPVARLQSIKTATNVRKNGGKVVVTDGPFAEAKEHLLGFYMIDCESIEEATEIAKSLQAANSGPSAYEIRPVMYYGAGGEAGKRI